MKEAAAKPERIKELIRSHNPDAILSDAVEAALVGVGHRCGRPSVAVYDIQEAIESLADAGTDYCEAADHVWANEVGAGLGEHGPIWLERPEEE